ncbi:hypothetical protein SDJN02_18420, partial [Cucurbita argyrosperma subsp. argyrosperma]
MTVQLRFSEFILTFSPTLKSLKRLKTMSGCRLDAHVWWRSCLLPNGGSLRETIVFNNQESSFREQLRQRPGILQQKMMMMSPNISLLGMNLYSRVYEVAFDSRVD